MQITMKRWVKFFEQEKFNRGRLSEGWRFVLWPDIDGEERLLEVWNETTTGNKTCWKVALKADGALDLKDFVPESAEMRLYDSQHVETAVLIGLTDKKYLLVCDPGDDLRRHSPENPLYDANEHELAWVVRTLVPGEPPSWSLILLDPVTQQKDKEAVKVADYRGASVLCLRHSL
jgi:hypothetical protein